MYSAIPIFVVWVSVVGDPELFLLLTGPDTCTCIYTHLVGSAFESGRSELNHTVDERGT